MDTDDMTACEACGKSVHYKDATSMVECWFCSDCTADWEREFKACSHRFVATTSSFGEPAAACDRCAGLVLLADFPLHGFDLASVQEDGRA